ncbi:MAG TPA: beta-glucosidase BglX [Fimbriimonadaceae bacterium]|jgi:beta-glucosidase
MLILALAVILPRQVPIEQRIDALLSKMTLQEKLGQMSQGGIPDPPDAKMLKLLREGRYGSLYGGASPETRIKIENAARQSRLGIPLILGADVIHGFNTGLPTPLGQAASFDPALVQICSRISAREASSVGIQWTFSPMMDIARDPRWGRMAEGYGEDPFLASAMAVATVKGYQGTSLKNADSLAACGKHYVGYGAAEAGRDYNSTWIPEGLLRDVYLKPFQACSEAGIASYMSAFNAINGVPATANPFTLKQVLRKEWGFDGMVVSDFDAVRELIPHGFAADGKDAARKSIMAGLDMEMISDEIWKYGPELVKSHQLDIKYINGAVRNILRTKFRLGLFDGRPQSATEIRPTTATMSASKKLAEESLVLLKNDKSILPLSKDIGKIAIIGPLADRPQDQLGSWANANEKDSVTPLAAIKAKLGDSRVLYAPAITVRWQKGWSYDQFLTDFLSNKDQSGFAEAVAAAQQADVVVVFLGEIQNISGEASSRSNLDLPGAQNELVDALAQTGKPIIGVVMAGRPLTMSAVTAKLSGLIYAWGPGSMAGPAIIDTLFGDSVPSGKLPVSFPRSVGQIPIYYDHLNTGRPILPDDSDHYTSRYLDLPNSPQYPFGFGLSYTTFEYWATHVKKVGEGFKVFAEVTNTGKTDAEEVVQLYTHRMAASVARPIRELKGFKRIHLKAGESQRVTFWLFRQDLAFWNQEMRFTAEPGELEAWIAPDSVSGTPAKFKLP